MFRAPPIHQLQRLCAAAEMIEMERLAIENIGIPGLVLMENAARSVADWVEKHCIQKRKEAKIVVCCGIGNNGGDGFAIARLLKNRNYDVVVVEAGTAKTSDAKQNQIIWRQFGESVSYTDSESRSHARILVAEADVIIDAIFGTGLERPVSGTFKNWIEDINANSKAIKIGVDLPSGVHSDQGQTMGVAAQCQYTLTFQVGKQGCFQFPGAQNAGKVVVRDISIPPHWPEGALPVFLLTRPFIRQLLPERVVDAHKGTYGHLLTVCGSSGMAGAVLLTSFAAIKNGSGLVTACVPRALRDVFLGQCPEMMTLSPVGDSTHHFTSSDLEFVVSEVEKRDAVVLGCGLGQSPETVKFVRQLVASTSKPLLIDADGLNCINCEILKKRSASTIITPHPRELSRLCGLTTAEIQKNRIEVTRRYAMDWGLILLLKGANTVISDANGSVYINPTGHEGMATGGSGDVLSGIIGSFLTQQCSPLQAALLGAYLHGTAGDCLKPALASSFLSATNLIHSLNEARLLLESIEVGTHRLAD